jgi:hypothetical protein
MAAQAGRPEADRMSYASALPGVDLRYDVLADCAIGRPIRRRCTTGCAAGSSWSAGQLDRLDSLLSAAVGLGDKRS